MSENHAASSHTGSVDHEDLPSLERTLVELRRVIVGQERLLERLLIALVAGGHCLLEGPPGLAKTLAVQTLADTTGGTFARVQFTPDLLPADIVGTRIYRSSSERFDVELGPVFANFVLADEINRAPAKVQSALLEVMAEGQVTIEGETHTLPPPFLVLATMNPLDHQGTYALPAAQMDRFAMQLTMGFPPPEAEMEMLDVHLSDRPPVDSLSAVLTRERFLEWQKMVPRIFIGEQVKAYLVTLANAIRSDARCLAPPSPRSVLMLARVSQAEALAAGRDFVSPVDVQAVAPDVFAHRLVISGDETGHAYVAEKLTEVDVPG